MQGCEKVPDRSSSILCIKRFRISLILGMTKYKGSGSTLELLVTGDTSCHFGAEIESLGFFAVLRSGSSSFRFLVLKPENKGSLQVLILDPGSGFRFPALVAGSGSALRC